MVDFNYLILTLNVIYNKENEFYEKFYSHDSDSENSRNYLNNNSNIVDTNSDSYSNEHQEHDEEYYYDDEDYDDPVY